MNKLAIIIFVFGFLFLGFGFYDHYKNPQYYKAVNIDKYTQTFYLLNSSNYSKDVTYYKFFYELPREFKIRFWFYRIMLGVSIFFLCVVVVMWWFNKPKEERENIIGGFNYEQENKEGDQEKGEGDSKEEKGKEGNYNNKFGG